LHSYLILVSSRCKTAIVITDPQNDFLSPDGATWGVVGESVTRNNTVENLDQLFKIAKEEKYHCFRISTLLFQT
jgi:nicotinamidase-related amidase